MRTFTNILSLACLIAITYSCTPEELSTDNMINEKEVHANTGHDDEYTEDRNGN